MTTQSTLGPFMTLILTLTVRGNHADNVIHSSRAKVVDSLLFVRLVVESLRQRHVRNTQLHRSVSDRQFAGISSQFVRSVTVSDVTVSSTRQRASFERRHNQ